jgi:transcription elongation factor Elf1
VSKSKPCPFCGMRDEACYVNGLNGAKVYQCQWCGAQTNCQEDWETRPLEESLRDKNEILQSKLARERQVSDALYLLLVDDPNTKLKADQILIDIYGKNVTGCYNTRTA